MAATGLQIVTIKPSVKRSITLENFVLSTSDFTMQLLRRQYSLNYLDPVSNHLIVLSYSIYLYTTLFNRVTFPIISFSQLPMFYGQIQPVYVQAQIFVLQ